MTDFLYKVSEPRDEWTFEPRPFWRAEDWSFSDDHPRDGLVEDRVLYAAEFDEINIHLLPRVWRLRVWLDDEERCACLKRLGFTWTEGSRAVLFARDADRRTIESFSPTVFCFDRSGFEQTPANEFVSREPRTALSAEKISFEEAQERWRFDIVYIASPRIWSGHFKQRASIIRSRPNHSPPFNSQLEPTRALRARAVQLLGRYADTGST